MKKRPCEKLKGYGVIIGLALFLLTLLVTLFITHTL